MIKGEVRIKDEEEDEEYQAYQLEQYYYYALLSFEGIEGRSYGIMDELHDLEKLIDLIGASIVKEEKEFKEIEKVEKRSEEPWPTNNILKVWHKKNYRQFSYRSMLMLIHTTFGQGLVNLYDLLLSEKRLKTKVDRRKSIDDILKVLQSDPSISGIMYQIRAFGFIRNSVAHAGGYYEDPSSDIEAFKKFVKDRTDIKITKLKEPKGRFNHHMEITKSSVLKDYLALIRKVFEGLLRGAQSLPLNTSN